VALALLDLPSLGAVVPVPSLRAIGIPAFTTTRGQGTYRLDGTDPAGDVVPRWHRLAAALRQVYGAERLASARQVHEATVLSQGGGWQGWLRADGADGHVTDARGTALCVGVADCVPIFLGHPSGMVGMLHAGWRGTVAGILDRGLTAFVRAGHATADVVVHLGPAICGRCYEVGPDVYQQLTGSAVAAPTLVDLRGVLADQARRLGVREVTVSPACTRCDGELLYSHRAGDAGRQLGVIIRPTLTTR
jgi:YfiH family protein